jgi:hypothetical protein
LLDKFAYGRPSQRLLQDLADHGLNMASGTLAGGLQAIAPLFKPLDDALLSKLRSQPYWHADETRWAVLRLTLCKAIASPCIPGSFRAFAKPPPDVSRDGPQKK